MLNAHGSPRRGEIRCAEPISNYAFNPIAEQALRANQTIVPQRVNAALGPNMDGAARLRELMESAVATSRLSLNTAREIEGIIAVSFSCEDELKELADALAQFSPGGGDYLFSEYDILPKFKRFLDAK